MLVDCVLLLLYFLLLLQTLYIERVSIKGHLLLLLVALLKPKNVDYPAIGTNSLHSFPHRAYFSKVDVRDKDGDLVGESFGEMRAHEGNIIVVGSRYDSSLVVHFDKDSLSE